MSFSTEQMSVLLACAMRCCFAVRDICANANESSGQLCLVGPLVDQTLALRLTMQSRTRFPTIWNSKLRARKSTQPKRRSSRPDSGQTQSLIGISQTSPALITPSMLGKSASGTWRSPVDRITVAEREVDVREREFANNERTLAADLRMKSASVGAISKASLTDERIESNQKL